MIVARDDVFHAERDESPCRIECRRRAGLEDGMCDAAVEHDLVARALDDGMRQVAMVGLRERVQGRIDGQAGHRRGEREPQVEPQQVPAGQPVAIEHDGSRVRRRRR